MNSTLRTRVADGASTNVPLGLARGRVDRVERIAVLSGGSLRDVLALTPAVEALAAAYPDASIVVLCSSDQHAILHGRVGPWDDAVAIPGLGADDPAHQHGGVADTVGRLAARRFDLAVQLHPDAAAGNGFLALLGARVLVGPAGAGGDDLDREVPVTPMQNSVMRALEIVAAVGATPVVLEPRIEVGRDDRRRAMSLLRPLGDLPGSPVIAMHAGGELRLRWPAGWFGDIAARAAGRGWRVVLVGGEDENRVGRDVIREAVGRGADCRMLLDLTGRTDPADLVGVLDAADAMVADDSGPVHVARAVGTPTVAISWIGRAVRSAPLTRTHHRVHLGWVTHCPVCGADAIHALLEGTSCGHDASLVAGVPSDPVWADLLDLVGHLGPRTAAAGPSDPHELDDY